MCVNWISYSSYAVASISKNVLLVHDLPFGYFAVLKQV